MRANLARHGRHIVARHTAAPFHISYSSPFRRRVVLRQPVCRTFQRTFLNVLFSKPPREIRVPEYEQGWITIMVWRSRMLDNLRPPKRKELLAAWRSLMQSKLRDQLPLNSTQAVQCRRLLQYLTNREVSEDNTKSLTWEDLATARQVLLDIEPIERSKEHADLARALKDAVGAIEPSGEPVDEAAQWSYLVRAMSRFGEAREASRELYAKWDDAAYSKLITGKREGSERRTGEQGVLDAVLEGLSIEGAEEELVELVNFALKNGIPYNRRLRGVVVDFFAKRDRVPETQEWFTKSFNASQVYPMTFQTVASFAWRNKLQDWALPLFKELGQTRPSKGRWDVLLQSMVLFDIPLEEIQTMMSHMVDLNGPLQPDIDTFNLMLKAAAEMVDPDLAKSIIAVAEDMDISPNEYTYLALLDLHLASGSVANSAAAFQGLQDAGHISRKAPASVWVEYGNLLNRYLIMASEQRPPNFEFILKLLNTVEEDKIHLAPETVAALCLRFLENDQNFDVMDILSIHAFRYSEAQRNVVQDAFVTFCLDKKNSTSRAWGAYQLVQQFFQDLSFERRTQLLQGFFDRKRPDMATYVFGHMRQHQNNAYQPKLDTYVQCFEGFAKNPDQEGVETVHNMLKMDTRVTPNTRLYTAMMLAFTGSGLNLRAIDLWNLIKQSREGPSYETLAAVFWTFQRSSGREKEARAVWQKIEQMDLEVPLFVYNAYVAAVAAGGNENEARGLIQKTASYVGTEPDIMT